ncbi:hypothetical protein H8L32_26870 [Undibacterium sp. CY18W]|uniref:Uncharacterized protein n=1 Tax=Undibacterium hunanense TaxID=2762292 RepID=A0ABR6ZZ25_9BURK|nr:hypothetical protein [Undibacterium hunanense]
MEKDCGERLRNEAKEQKYLKGWCVASDEKMGQKIEINAAVMTAPNKTGTLQSVPVWEIRYLY